MMVKSLVIAGVVLEEKRSIRAYIFPGSGNSFIAMIALIDNGAA